MDEEKFCAEHLEHLVKLDETKFIFDADHVLAENVKNNLTYNFNDFQRCLTFSKLHPDNQQKIEGQYCMTEYTTESSSKYYYSGLCYPRSCPSSIVESITTDSLEKLNKNIIGHWCQKTNSELRIGDYFAIVFFSLWVAIIIASTIYDYIMIRKESSSIKWLTTFSLYTNIKRTFKKIRGTKNEMNCLYAIRTLSILWLIISDRFLLMSKSAMTNESDYKNWLKNGFSIFIIASDVAYDSMFIVTGFLMATYCFSAFSMKNMNYLQFLLHRLIRYIPMILVSVIYHLSLMKYFINGPLTHVISARVENCENYWFMPLVILENFMGASKMCLYHGWYFSIDFQFFIIAPLFIYFCHKSRKIGFFVLGILVITMHLTIFGVIIDSYMAYEIMERDSIYHMRSYFRCVPWFSSIVLASFCLKNELNLKKKFSIIGSVTAIPMFIIYFIFVYSIQNKDLAGSDVYAGSSFAALHRIIWSIAICWIIFYCYKLQPDDFISRILNSSMWKPIGKLSQTILIVYPIYQNSTVYSMKIAYYFDSWEIFHTALGDILMSIFLAIILNAGVEMPFVLIEQLIYDKEAKKNKNFKGTELIYLDEKPVIK